MFEWLKKLFRKKEKLEWKPYKIQKDFVEKIEPKLEHVQKGIVSAASVQDVREQLEKAKEEQIKKEFLPEPQTHRRITSHSYMPPAERHREAISKAMKGKASSRYLKTIKKSPKIKMEEDEN
jgi:hypothetical protein